jgi:hypothetical protein
MSKILRRRLVALAMAAVAAALLLATNVASALPGGHDAGPPAPPAAVAAAHGAGAMGSTASAGPNFCSPGQPPPCTGPTTTTPLPPETDANIPVDTLGADGNVCAPPICCQPYVEGCPHQAPRIDCTRYAQYPHRSSTDRTKVIVKARIKCTSNVAQIDMYLNLWKGSALLGSAGSDHKTNSGQASLKTQVTAPCRTDYYQAESWATVTLGPLYADPILYFPPYMTSPPKYVSCS